MGIFGNELVATTVFFVVLLKLPAYTTHPVLQPIVAGIGLFMGAMVDKGAHMNPAVSLMMTATHNINASQCATRIVAQCISICAAIL